MKEIVSFKSCYQDFMQSQTERDKLKIRRILLLLITEDKIPSHFIKHLEDGIYELRITLQNTEARFLYFYDGITLIIICNCLVKKSRKLPKKEIEKVKRLRKAYYEQKR